MKSGTGIALRCLAFVTATVLLSALTTLGSTSAAHATGENTILSLVNQARASQNLGPLKLNSSVSAVANAWANHMASDGAMSHNPSYSSQIPSGWTRAAENVAHGYSSPSAVHDGWMNSPGHRANILGDFTDIGISFISAGGTTWAVENFAKYGASVPAPNPPNPPSPPAPSAKPSASPSPTTSASATAQPSDPSTPPENPTGPGISESDDGAARALDSASKMNSVPSAVQALGAVLIAVALLFSLIVGMRLRKRWRPID